MKAALAQNRLHIRACKQRARRQELAEQHAGLSSLAVRKVLAVYALSSWRLDAAVLAAKQLAAVAEAPTQEFILKIFREQNLDDLLHMHDETHKAWSQARTFAMRFLLEHDTWSWVKKMNVAQGVAPSAASVFHWYESRLHAVPPPGQPRKRTMNKWVARWRHRWGVRKAQLRVADQMQPDILQQKAGWRSMTIGFHFAGPGATPKRRPLDEKGQFWGSENGLILGFQNTSFLTLILSVPAPNLYISCPCDFHARWPPSGNRSHSWQTSSATNSCFG